MSQQQNQSLNDLMVNPVLQLTCHPVARPGAGDLCEEDERSDAIDQPNRAQCHSPIPIHKVTDFLSPPKVGGEESLNGGARNLIRHLWKVPESSRPISITLPRNPLPLHACACTICVNTESRFAV